MEIEERSFPLTKLTSEIVVLTETLHAESDNKGTPTSANVERKRQSTLSRIVTEIVKAFAKSAESSRCYYITSRSNKDSATE